MKLITKELKKRAGDLDEDQRIAFAKEFYLYAPDDTESPSPWGCPWDYHENLMLVGDSVEDMARIYWLSVKKEIEQLLDEKGDI